MLNLGKNMSKYKNSKKLILNKPKKSKKKLKKYLKNSNNQKHFLIS